MFPRTGNLAVLITHSENSDRNLCPAPSLITLYVLFDQSFPPFLSWGGVLFAFASLGGSPLTQNSMEMKGQCLYLKQLVNFREGLTKARPPQLSFLSLWGLHETGCLPVNEHLGLEQTPSWFFPQSAGVPLAEPSEKSAL